MISLAGLLFALFFLPASLALFFLAEEVRNWGD
jgi:hypothetical protein